MLTNTSPIFDEDIHQTNIPGMYIAGVVCGGLTTINYFLANANDYAEKVIGHIQHKVPLRKGGAEGGGLKLMPFSDTACLPPESIGMNVDYVMHTPRA